MMWSLEDWLESTSLALERENWVIKLLYFPTVSYSEALEHVKKIYSKRG
jgi:hypothetical protein